MAANLRDKALARLSQLFILLAAFALRLHELSRQDIWWDEARNIAVALRPFLDIPTAPELDIHPPLYFWLLHLWASLNDLMMGDLPQVIAYISRYLSVAMGMVSLVLLYALVRLIVAKFASSSSAPFYTLLIGACSPFWLAESQETRMYTLGFVLLTGAAYFLLEMMDESDQNQQAGRAIAFVLLSTLALLAHYNALFILATWYLWWTIWALLRVDRWLWVRIILMTGLGTLLLLAPFMATAWDQISGYANPNLSIPTVADYLQQNWRAYLGGYAFDLALINHNGMTWLWACLGLWIAGLLWLAKNAFLKKNWIAFAPITFLATWLIGGLILYYIAVLNRGAFNVRYSSFVTPALYGLMGIALANLAWVWRIIGIAVVMVGLGPALYADIYDTRFDRSDVSSLSTWLREIATAEDVIFVDQRYPFGFYYQGYINNSGAGSATADSRCRGAYCDRDEEIALARYLFVDINTIDQELSHWAGEAKQVFWVQWFESDTDPRRSVSFLLDKAGTRAGERWFQGYSVDWWDLTPPNQFELASTLEPLHYHFPPTVKTVEIALPPAEFQAGDVLPVVVRWQRMANSQISRPLKARVALYDQADARLLQNDKRLLNDRHLWPDQWAEDEQPLNVYKLETPVDLSAGEYEIRLLIYDAENLEPVGVVDEAGNHRGVEVVVGRVRCCN